jgi:acetyl esterase
MSTIEVDPGIQTLLDALAAMGPTSFAELGADAVRTMFKQMAFAGEPVPVASIRDDVAGSVPVRIYRPADGELPVLVWFHGGGFVIGDLDTTDSAARQLAVEAGCVVVSVDYRLAPEHRYPAAADDCWAALEWVLANASSLGVDPARVAVGGDSAGGNLAAVVALRARDAGIALRHQLLVYPVTDLTASFPSRVENGEGYFLTKDAMDWFERSYLDGQDPKDPGASPLHAPSLTGLAPAHVLTAGFDPLRDEGQAYAEALAAAGVDVVDDRYPTLIHGFFQMNAISPVAAEAASRAAALLGSALAE